MEPDYSLKETVIRAGHKTPLKYYLKDLWQFRFLLWVFVVRDIKIRYSQTLLGFSWIVLAPLISVGVFTFVFGMLIKIPSDGLPYMLFYLVSIIPWHAFLAMINLTTGAVEGNTNLVTRIYFPRLLLGGSYTLSAGVDYLVGFGMIIICALFYNKLSIQLFVLFPILFVIQVLFAMGLGLILCPLNTKYRDVKFFIPLAMQLYYFANPILYPVSSTPQWIRLWYEFNPMSMVICAYRDALKGNWPNLESLLFGLIGSILVFVLGFAFFRKHEQALVDII